ncbi:Protein of unknown function [Pseudooceanicola antarcticus]|uniref:DUF1523 domain-containing protein n=1 Tax=Pseudooceanicola antarcticus TaxID=1247613 RepID=A0A285HY69_9RHOB|nr:DUF1523 family protein [Pseudooceanicola antarcticus]PJE30375.1 DUF1523 domain-containing protein [Pseudooceanicola antarcticus]SNY40678.1 Protein of unknown function [Pseudooceanicola antarcticus]
MRYVKWTLWGLFWLLVAAFFHYTLPQRDIVRISDTYERRIDFGENSIFWAKADTGNAAASINRDVFFIQTIRKNGKPMVYRNEDTGWGWPPYFKFDTSNLQTEAADLRSTSAAPQWVAVTHYGWRNEFLSIFPNAVAMKPVEGPDVRLIPWLNIVILLFVAAIFWAIRVRWIRFRERRIDPLVEGAEDSWDEGRGRVGGWLNSWRKRK